MIRGLFISARCHAVITLHGEHLLQCRMTGRRTESTDVEIVRMVSLDIGHTPHDVTVPRELNASAHPR